MCCDACVVLCAFIFVCISASVLSYYVIGKYKIPPLKSVFGEFVLRLSIYMFCVLSMYVLWLQNALNKVYLNLLETMLKTEYFYFSTTYDLTHTLQRLHNTSPDFESLALHERVSWCGSVACVHVCVSVYMWYTCVSDINLVWDGERERESVCVCVCVCVCEREKERCSLKNQPYPNLQNSLKTFSCVCIL